MAKFTVNVEQPFIRSYDIEAEDMEQAEEIARKRYEEDGSVFTLNELGTDAQFQVIDDATGECTEWM